jgi:hypothetical protein
MAKRKPTATELAARQFRWGQLISGIESAQAALAVAARAGDLLSREDRDRLNDAAETLAGIEQLAWRLSGR